MNFEVARIADWGRLSHTYMLAGDSSINRFFTDPNTAADAFDFGQDAAPDLPPDLFSATTEHDRRLLDRDG
jgi:hypothetical protein